MPNIREKYLLLLFVIIFTRCASDSTEDITIELPALISYTANVKSIIDQSCATSGCHNTSSNAANLTLETYAEVENAFLTRNALDRMESTNNPMPPSGNLPSTSIAIITNWIDQGYLE